jgi:hypothetical protein
MSAEHVRRIRRVPDHDPSSSEWQVAATDRAPGGEHIDGQAANRTPGLARPAAEASEGAQQAASGITHSLARMSILPPAESAAGSAGGPLSPETSGRIEAARGDGAALDAGTRASMEGAFGTSFANVRIHADGEADALNRSVDSTAFTTGSDVFFSQGRFQPDTDTGRHLLAHELTHVVQQQGASTGGPMTVGSVDNAYEREAEGAAGMVSQGGAIPGSMMGATSQRQPSPTTAAPAHPRRDTRRSGIGPLPALGRASLSIQRFDEGEHKGIGDAATGQGTIYLAPDMPVTYGDMVALGDYFDDWPTLVQLARIQGITEGTRGEVWYAILVQIRPKAEGRSREARDDAEAKGMGTVFDAKAKAAVNKRYLGVTVNNIAHFPNPRKGDAGRSQADKDAGPHAEGGGATYRQNHYWALLIAAGIGQEHHRVRVPKLNDALMIEAFADHFLTDAFSAGHQQTERASVKEYWDARVPDFQQHLKRWLVDSLTLELRRKPQSTLTKVGSHMSLPWVAENITLPIIEAKFAAVPTLGFGDLVSGAMHDYFNAHGAQADVAGRRITLVGDTHLLSTGGGPRHVTDKGRDTFNAAKAAVQAGIAEVHHAAELGRQGEDPERVPEMILKAGGGMFAAEQLMPTLADDATVADPQQQSLNWQLGSFEDVLADPRLAEGLAMAISGYAEKVSRSLSGLDKEQTDVLKEVLIDRMTAGQESVVRLLREIITHTPIQLDAGYNPDLLNDFPAAFESMH